MDVEHWEKIKQERLGENPGESRVEEDK